MHAEVNVEPRQTLANGQLLGPLKRCYHGDILAIKVDVDSVVDVVFKVPHPQLAVGNQGLYHCTQYGATLYNLLQLSADQIHHVPHGCGLLCVQGMEQGERLVAQGNSCRPIQAVLLLVQLSPAAVHNLLHFRTHKDEKRELVAHGRTLVPGRDAPM